MKKVNSGLPFAMKILLSALLLTAMAACNKDKEVNPMTITDIVLENNDFTILRTVVTYAGMSDALKTSNITVFAPNDAAFKASGYADASALTSLPAATVRQILDYHVLSSIVKSSDFVTTNNQATQTIVNKPIFISKNTSGLSVNGAKIITADLKADNGVIHVIDRVLLPATKNLLGIIQGDPDFTYLAAAAARAASANTAIATALISDASVFTVLAPTNQAFVAAGFPTVASLDAASPATLANILLYHVLPGRVFTTNLVSGNIVTANNTPVRVDANDPVKITSTKSGSQSANVTKANVLATNGVLHVIDRVLLP